MPWQDCSLATDDFLVVRLMEVVVHADDLAASVGLPTPAFDDDVLHPALALLAMLGSRVGTARTPPLRALAREERASPARRPRSSRRRQQGAGVPGQGE